MSVRRSTVKASRAATSESMGVAKGILFWGSLLAGSFLFGLLVVSPIYNRIRREPAEHSVTSNPAPQPSPQTPAMAVPNRVERREPRTVQPDIAVTPDQDSAAVQRPENVERQTPNYPDTGDPRASQDALDAQGADQEQARAELNRSAPQDGLIQPLDSQRDPSLRADAPVSGEHLRRNGRARRNRRAAEEPPADTSAERTLSSSDAAVPTDSKPATRRRSRRSGSASQRDSGSTAHSDSRRSGEVQKGETIE